MEVSGILLPRESFFEILKLLLQALKLTSFSMSNLNNLSMRSFRNDESFSLVLGVSMEVLLLIPVYFVTSSSRAVSNLSRVV